MENTNTNTNKFKVILEANAGENYTLYKLHDSERIQNNGNTKRFCDIIGKNWVILRNSTKRVENDKNPHLAEKLAEQNCNNWKIDGLTYCYEDKKQFTTDKTTTYIFDTENGTITRKLEAGECICKTCGRIIPKTAVVGLYCEKCLTDSEGLAYRFGYHSFYGEYKIYEDIDTNKTPVFGCEIERDYLGSWGSNFEVDLTTAMLDTIKTMHTKEIKSKKEIKRKNVFMRDSSLNNHGCEWITYPQSYKEYKKNINNYNLALELFKKSNFGNSDNVGNHIHINRSYFGNAHKLGACKLALLFARFWGEFVAIAKRNSTSYTRKPAHTENDNIFDLVEKSIRAENDHSVAINTQHDNTIEFRLWSGIDTGADLLLYLDITQSVATFAKKKSVDTCQKCKFTDVLVYLNDKSEHLAEIKKRLNDKGITKHDAKIEALKGGAECV